MSATIATTANGVVEQVGAYAGYAAIVGLGILALLYFTQARELKRLREWAGRAPERAAELEERVQADAQKRVVAQPVAPASAAGQQTAAARAQAATAAVYASVGAQPPGAAPPPPGQLARSVVPKPAAPVPAPGAVPPAPGAAPAAAAGAPAPAASAAAPSQSPAPAPSPTGRPIVTATPAPTPAGAPAAATAAARVAAASRAIASPPNGAAGQETTESAAARPEPLPGPPPPPLSRFTADDDANRDAGGARFSPARVALIVGGAVATILVAVVLMVTLGGDDNPPPQNSFGTPSAAGEPGAEASKNESGPGSSPASSALTSAERRATNIAVLNGTTQTGLARAVATKIQKDGFTIRGVATNDDQSVPTTIVSYTGDNEKAARAVAKIIGIDGGSVQAGRPTTIAAADADVVVTVGSDQIE